MGADGMAEPTVGDVLGKPESWPNTTAVGQGMPAMHDAVIVYVLELGDEITIATDGASTGPTFSTLEIKDPAMRAALVRVLRTGLNVDDAVALQV